MYMTGSWIKGDTTGHFFLMQMFIRLRMLISFLNIKNCGYTTTNFKIQKHF